MRFTTVIVTLGLGLALAACATTPDRTAPGLPEAPLGPSTPAPPAPRNNVFDERGVILVGDGAAWALPDRREGTWTPRVDAVAPIDSALASLLAEKSPTPRLVSERDASEILERGLARYGRQWVGVVVEGRRLLYGNFFAFDPAAHPDWQRSFVFVCDGGSAYFQVLYDPETGRFEKITVNGEA